MREATLSETKRGAPSRGRRDTPGAKYQKNKGYPLYNLLFRKNAAQLIQCILLRCTDTGRSAVHFPCNFRNAELAEKEALDYLLFPFPQILQTVPNLMIPLRLQNLLFRLVPAVGRGSLPIVFRSFTVACFIMYFTVTTGLLPVDLVKQITVYSLC